MVFPELGGGAASTGADEEEPFLVPLAVPMIAGPSAVAAILLLVSRDPGGLWTWWAALSTAWAVSAAVLLGSGLLMEALGRRTVRALVRLSGMLLIMMAVQMLMDGVAVYMRDMS
jgi:multiple antibiotic resistance protein